VDAVDRTRPVPAGLGDVSVVGLVALIALSAAALLA
jgi:hypothetical protein